MTKSGAGPSHGAPVKRRTLLRGLGVASAAAAATVAAQTITAQPAAAYPAGGDLIYVPDYCTGSGTGGSPWISSDGTAGLAGAIAAFSDTARTVYLPAGVYATSGNRTLDFNTLWTSTQKTLATERFALRGNGAQVLINGGTPLTGGGAGLAFTYSAAGGCFFWEFSGIEFVGNVDDSLVHIGSLSTLNFAFNSCIFDLVCNNKYIAPDSVARSRGITLRWPLESRINLVSAAASGYGAVLELMEFCTVKGSFSNGLKPSGTAIYDNALGLYLLNCASNSFTSVNLENCYDCVQLVGETRGNVFTCFETTNCDNRGWVLDNSYISTDVTNKNVITFLNRRGVIQGTGLPQTTFSAGSNQSLVPLQFQYP